MNKKERGSPVLLLFLLTLLTMWLITARLALAQATPPELPLAGEEQIVFQKNSPQPWSVSTTGQSGGNAKITPQDALLQLTFSKPDSGAGVHIRPRLKAKPFLTDTNLCVEVIFQSDTPDLPQNLQAVLRIDNKKPIASQWRAVSDAVTQQDGLKKIRFIFSASADIEDSDKIIGALIVSREQGQMTVHQIALQQLRHIAVHIANDYRTYMNKLDIQGQTLTPDGDVLIRLADAAGKKYDKRVKAENGRFALTWENPPLTQGKENVLSARLGNGKEIMDNSVPKMIFGYAANTDHVWLRAKGKDIVTSPQSKGGEQQFIAVGVGYAKDVIIPAQDEDVAAFCKSQGLNTIRLAFYTRFFNNRSQEPIDINHHIRTFIDPVVQAAKRHGLYVILDDHGYFSGKIDEAKARQQQSGNRWSEEGVSEWARRWGVIADYYKNEPYVLGYELCNEPHDIEAATVRDWYSRALKEIRKVDTRHIVMVGTNDWSHARALEKTWGEVATSFDAPHNNVVYAFHDYPEDNHPWIVQKHITKFRDKYNVPVMCTEFGATWWNKDETVCREFQAGMLGLFAKENVSWMIWALGGLKNNPRNATPLPDKIRKEKNIPRLPKSEYDSCAYSDIWVPIARIMGSEFPQPKTEK